MTGFFEDDEPVDQVRAAFDAGEKGVTAPPAAKFGSLSIATAQTWSTVSALADQPPFHPREGLLAELRGWERYGVDSSRVLQVLNLVAQEGPDSVVALSSGTGTPAEEVSGGSGDAERQHERDRRTIAYLLDMQERGSRQLHEAWNTIERYIAAMATVRTERDELRGRLADAEAGWASAVKVSENISAEVARYRAAVEKAMPRLVYASSPTMGLPAGRDAAEFASEATELMAREALRNCILNARDAKAALAAALGDGA